MARREQDVGPARIEEVQITFVAAGQREPVGRHEPRERAGLQREQGGRAEQHGAGESRPLGDRQRAGQGREQQRGQRKDRKDAVLGANEDHDGKRRAEQQAPAPRRCRIDEPPFGEHERDRHHAERDGMRHRRLEDDVPEQRRRRDDEDRRDERDRRAELAPQAQVQDEEARGHHHERRDVHRTDVWARQATRGAGVWRRGSADAAHPVDRGDGKIRWRPRDRRANRHDVVWTRRLMQRVELRGDVQIVIEDDAPQMRDVERAVARDAVVQCVLSHAEAEQERDQEIDIERTAHPRRTLARPRAR